MAVLLFVDDDKDILESNMVYFKKLGHSVITATSASDALGIISSAKLDCVILDIDMPDINGFDACRRLRETTSVPVIFLSGLTADEMRIDSFLAGGDDYLAKPFNVKELELRISARMQAESLHISGEVHKFGELVIDTKHRTVSYDGRVGDFTALQFDVLEFLARHPKQVFSYEQIYDRVWKMPIIGSRHNLQVIMATVRQKLSALCDGKNYIETLPRKGYRFIELMR